MFVCSQDVLRATLNLPVVIRRLGRSDIIDMIMNIERESGVDISLKSTEWVLTGGWQQIVRAKESIEKQFTSITSIRGSGLYLHMSDDPYTAQYSITAQDVGGSGGRLSGMVERDDVPCETGAQPSPENTDAYSPERVGVCRKGSSTSPDEVTEALTEKNKQSDKGYEMACANEAIPIDVNIWQYIEDICGNQLAAIECEYGSKLTADEHGDVVMVTISDGDNVRDSMARSRFIELHSDVMSRVVVVVFKPLPQIYDGVKLKAACRRVQYAFRHNVLVKAERGRYTFIGEVNVAKKARGRFMKWAQIPQASWTTTNQRNHCNPVSPKQTAPPLDTSLESPENKTREMSVPDVPQKRAYNSRNVDASQGHRPNRDISMPPSNKRIIFEFQDQPSCGSELGRVQTGVFVSAEPQTGTLSKLHNSPTTLHNVGVLPVIDPAHHPESRETQRMCEQVSKGARTAMAVDHADNNDTPRRGVARNESGTKVDVSDVRNETLGSEFISTDEGFGSFSNSVYMVNTECAYSEITGNDRLAESTVDIFPAETHDVDVGLGNSTATSPDANTASTRQTIGMVDAPVDNEVVSQRLTCLLTGDVVSERHTDTADSSECAESLSTASPAYVACCLRPTVYAFPDATPGPVRFPDTMEMDALCPPGDQDLSAIVTLKQPAGGTLSKLIDDKTELPGYQQVDVILIMYNFPSGILTVGIDGKCFA